MRILGISAFYHDSAAALIEDGRIVAAAQEERFTRKKYDSSYPANAIAYCLAELGIQFADVDYVAFYDKPFLKFTRLLETYLAFAPKGFASFRTAMPLWLKDKLFQRKKLGQTLRAAAPDFDWRRRLLFSEHHLSHAASAFFPSPFDHAAILTMDGSFRLDQRHFDYCTGLRMTNDSFAALFGVPARKPEDPLEPVHMDLAASIQRVTEEVILRLTRSLAAETGTRSLCLAGGVALNCVANGKVLRDGRFDDVWVQPAAGDAGGAVGAALAAYHQFKGNARKVATTDGMSGAFLGPEFSQGEVERRLKEAGARFEVLSEDAMIEATAKA